MISALSFAKLTDTETTPSVFESFLSILAEHAAHVIPLIDNKIFLFDITHAPYIPYPPIVLIQKEDLSSAEEIIIGRMITYIH